MGIPRAKSEVFTISGTSYLNDRIAERLTGYPEKEYETVAMTYGKEMEPQALQYFATLTGKPVQPADFIKSGADFGCSPDGWIPTENAGLEVKCPYSSSVMVEYLQLSLQEDLKEHYPAYYWQCMFSLYLTQWSRWYWMAYDPRMKDETLRSKLLVIEPCPEDFNRIQDRLPQISHYLNSPLFT
jgi:hypothetical protein